MDGAYIASYDIAVNKTFTSAGLKMSTAELANLSQPGQPLYGIQHTNEGKIVIFGGGEPLEIDGKKQTLNFDDAGHFYTFSSKKPVTAKQVKLIIDSVYLGSKWQDTCISEVEFYGTR